jgi:hypothetical protein
MNTNLKYLIPIALATTSVAAQADFEVAPITPHQQQYNLTLAECQKAVSDQADSNNVGKAFFSGLIGVLTGLTSHGHNVIVPVLPVSVASDADVAVCMAARGWTDAPTVEVTPEAAPCDYIAGNSCGHYGHAAEIVADEPTEAPSDNGTLGGELGVNGAGEGEGLGAFGAIDVFGLAASYYRE